MQVGLDAHAVGAELAAKLDGMLAWLNHYVGSSPGPGMELLHGPNQRGVFYHNLFLSRCNTRDRP